MPSPWVALGARPDLILLRQQITEPARYYDAQRAIVIRRGLLIEEERRYLWHELVHADRRDKACDGSAATERSVEREAVQRAIPRQSLEWAWMQAQDWHELADLLKLPEEWVRWRHKIAHPAEKELLRRQRQSLADPL